VLALQIASLNPQPEARTIRSLALIMRRDPTQFLYFLACGCG
jgi:hypothetical protein